MFVKNNLLYSELPITTEIDSVEDPYIKATIIRTCELCSHFFQETLLKLSCPGFCEGCRENLMNHDITANSPEKFQMISSLTEINQSLQNDAHEIPVKKTKCRFRSICTHDFLKGGRITKKGKPIKNFHVVSVDHLKKWYERQ